jgi:UDP-glucose 4-epimerase
MANILVTGGAGYIGSHVVKLLGQAGHHVVTLDNLSKGNRGAVLYGELVVGDTGDSALVTQTLTEHQIETVMHFAAWTIVPESVSDPLKYYRNNTCSARNLIECCVATKVQHFIFSSTAAVYGIPATPVCREDTPKAPINPYGSSKLMAEQILRDACTASGMRHVILRYFNVAGSDPDTEIGQSTKDATLLIKVACEVATGKRAELLVFGTNYPTADGTGVRDYIHVCDLATAHLRAMDYLAAQGESTTLNCGYGHGYSVRQVIDVIERLTGAPLPVRYEPRRAGDPPELVADASALNSRFAWEPKFDDLTEIVRTSLAWERKIAAGLVTEGRART